MGRTGTWKHWSLQGFRRTNPRHFGYSVLYWKCLWKARQIQKTNIKIWLLTYKILQSWNWKNSESSLSYAIEEVIEVDLCMNAQCLTTKIGNLLPQNVSITIEHGNRGLITRQSMKQFGTLNMKI